MQDSAGPQFVISGVRRGTSPDYQGTYGYYWSSSAYTPATRAHVLLLNGVVSTVTPADDSGKRSGFSLHCLGQ